jgi:predicted permease
LKFQFPNLPIPCLPTGRQNLKIQLMFKNYFKTAWRNVRKNKVFAFINITGLAIGIAASLILFIIVKYELSYDTFQKNYNNIYRVVTQEKYSDGITYNDGIAIAASEALKTYFPQVTFSEVASTSGSQVTINDNKKFIEDDGIFFCGPEFFKVFDYTWLNGNATSLKDPNSVVLSQATAEKYFGNWQQAIGKTIKLDNNIVLKVTGILANAPANSSFPMDVLISYQTFKSNTQYGYTDEWNGTSSSFQTYALLPPNVDPAFIDKQLAAFSSEHYKGGNSKKSNFLQPLSSLHFDDRFSNLAHLVTSKSSLWTLSLIGIFILLMACINFINLSTAQAVKRSKEVGIRKVLGSNRMQLFFQVMSETFLIVLLAVAIAVIISYTVLPYAKNIASIPEPLSLFGLSNVALLIGVTIAVTFLAGTYPSFIIARFNSLQALKNKISSAKASGISLRRSLVVVQFAISQVLIIGTVIAVSQMDFVQKADLGFNKDAVLMIDTDTDSVTNSRLDAFKTKLLSLSGIQNVSLNSDAPSSNNNWSTNFAFDHHTDESFQMHMKFGDADYLKTFGLKLIAGTNFTESDTAKEALVNETMVKMLNQRSPDKVLGKQIKLGGNWLTVTGVVKDFKDHSLRENIKPVVITTLKKVYSETSIKIHSSNLKATTAAIEKTWNEFFPEYAYKSYFLDDTIAHFYDEENHLSLLYKIFAGIAIVISCLGLYGLVSFMATQKTKEIGIRKVLGASVANIIYLFSKEFTVLIVIAFAIAIPVAYYIMSNWLNNFAFRINITIWFFVLAIVSSVVIALLTVGYKSVRSALANPVKSLRTE